MPETVTVTQLNNRARNILAGSPAVRDIWVDGEISNLTRAGSGHYYFTLKDSGSEIRAAMFKNARQRIDFEPKDNMRVTAFGSVDIYVQRGAYQFIVATMRRSGIGDLFLAFQELKGRLESEGLFDASRKRPIPAYPRRIGVVTSETGAVIHDIITTSASRFPADIVLAPSMVQGEGAADTIVAAIDLLNRYGVDVIVVARGGGSLEDLWPFNEERVARAIASSSAPVVSAVGHETDFTIADFAADLRAPTPTGAAALILRDRAEVSRQVSEDMARATRALQGILREMRHRFERADARLSPRTAGTELAMTAMGLDDLSGRMDAALNGKVADMRRRFDVADARLSPSAALSRMEALSGRVESLWARAERAVSDKVSSGSAALASADGRLRGLDPRSVLSRGYGLVTDPTGRAVTSVEGLREGSRVVIGFSDGSASAEVKEVTR